MTSLNKYHRYQRQTVLKEFGTAAQEKLFRSKVLVVGAGGLGCPALQYLAAAGVGTIGIVDFDIVEFTNLQRQTLYSVEDIGKLKAQTAADKMKAFNPDILFHIHNIKLDSKNSLDIISSYDVVMDGTDNFATRYLINDACMLLNKPLLYGAVLRFEGQIGVFNMEDKDTNIKSNYRDLFPVPPDPASAPSCNEAGVLGVLPGIIGTMQATEVIKIITGIGKPLCNTIISYNALTNLFYDFMISPAKGTDASVPKNKEEFEKFDYEWFCNAHAVLNELTPAEFDALRIQEKIEIIDVREIGELPEVDEFLFTQIPLSVFENELKSITIKNKIVVFCQTGKRSLAAVKILNEKFPKCSVWSLKGGIEAWKKDYLNSLHASSIKP